MSGQDERVFRSRVSRRGVLGGALGILAAGAAAPLIRPAAAGADPVAPTSRAAFDAMDLALNDGNGLKNETNDSDSSGLSGKLAWAEAYVMAGYMLMYRTYRDPYYLDKLVDHADAVLANRDSVRGVRDFEGKSHPAWRADNPYTIGAVAVPGADGAPALSVRTALAYGNDAVATVSPGSAPGLFRLDVTHHHYSRTTTYTDLSMDSASADYAVARVRHGYRYEKPQRVQVTVKDLRAGARGPLDLVPGRYPLSSAPYVFDVHTGQIVQPMAEFARVVLSDPDLTRAYGDKAAEYVDAVEQAVAVHDREWRENADGEGYYITLPGAPVWWAGMDNPINHFLALGRAIIPLAALSLREDYRDKAWKLAHLLRDQVALDDTGAFTWPYWWSKGKAYNGWDIDDPATEYRPWMPGNPVAEDTSHSQIDLNFALEYYRERRVFDELGRPNFMSREMSRFAATFTQHIAAFTADGVPSVNRYIDGSGATGLAAYERQAGAWADMAPWDPAVLAHLVAVFNAHEFAGVSSTIYCIARLNHAAHAPRATVRR